MNEPRIPRLEILYQAYLVHERTASFLRAVTELYSVSTLIRLAEAGGRTTRRGAVLALSLLSGREVVAALGEALRDEDRGVRLLAENGIRDAWQRVGNESQRRRLREIIRLNQCGQAREVVRRAGQLIQEIPDHAEAYNQRAIALYHLERFADSAQDCLQAVEINPYHYGAAVGLAHCYLEMEDPYAALEALRQAIRLNPSLTGVQEQVEYLERSLEG